MSAIKTFVFIDLETNGLIGLNGTNTKITQLSMSACSVDHIMDLKDNDIPRVIHRLTLCFNPRKLIKLDCSAITGLTNELLEKEKKFDENTVDLILNFLNHLQQPVCLVAHNGNNFDYPLLKSHCKALNKSLPETLLCCDSLIIFKKITQIYEQNTISLVNGHKLTTWEKINSKDHVFIDSEILEIEELLKNYESDEEDVKVTMTVSQLENEFLQDKVKTEPSTSPIIDDVKTFQVLNETTPNKPVKNEQTKPPPKKEEATSSKRSLNGSRRKLFSESEDIKTLKNGKKVYPKGYFTLRGIYNRLFGEYPENSHDAESDVKALLKCVCACKKEFLDVVIQTACNFCDVKDI